MDLFARSLAFTTIADIWFPIELHTVGRNIILTVFAAVMILASGAALAALLLAQIFNTACTVADTVIIMGDAVKDKFPVGFYFSCNSGRMTFESFCDLFERPAAPQQLSDNKAISSGDVFFAVA